jgi:hypothetical protein
MESIFGLRARVMDAITVLGLPDDVAANMFAEMGDYITRFGAHIHDNISEPVKSEITFPVVTVEEATGLDETVVSSFSEDLVEVQKFFENSHAVDWFKSASVKRELYGQSYERVTFGRMCLPDSTKLHVEARSGSASVLWGSSSIVLEPNIHFDVRIPDLAVTPAFMIIAAKQGCDYEYWFTRDEIGPCSHGRVPFQSVAIRNVFKFLEYHYVIQRSIRGKDPGEDRDILKLLKLSMLPD